MDNLSYNFAIFGTSDKFYIAAYNDIMNLENVRYLAEPLQTNNKVIKAIYRIHTSPKINRYINLPFKQIYCSKFFVNDFKNNLPICFVFFGHLRGKILEWGYYKYLKRKYPNSKLVCIFQDLISSNKNVKIKKFRRYFDLILTFDQADAKRYGFTYYPLVYSKNCPFFISDSFPNCDVFFVGKAKNRLNDITLAYEKLTQAGLKCDFHVVAAEKKLKSSNLNGIDYCSFMEYEEYLGRMKAANCVLELIQHGGHGFTMRVNEAIALNKKIISNNKELINAPFYNSSYISIFKDANKIDINFAKEKIENIDYKYVDELSPRMLIRFIEDSLINFK